MKNFRPLPFAILFMAIFFSQCKKNKDEQPQLPPETTIGAMTFGCKVDGKVFVPKDGRGRTGLYVQYVNLGNVPGGGWQLVLPAYNYSTEKGVNIFADSLLLIEGNTYEFSQMKGSPLAMYENLNNGSIEIFGKLDGDPGSIYIKKHDQINRILAGTFFFTGTKILTGEKISVTEGRFDIWY